MSLRDKLDQKRFATRDVTICLDGELNARHAAATQAITAAAGSRDQRLGGGVAAAKRELAEIEQQMEAASITLRFTAVPHHRWNAFLLKHPPRPKNVADASMGYNPQTFFGEVAQKTGQYLDDGTPTDISPADWTEIDQAITDGDYERIATALLDINRTEGLSGVPFSSRGSDATTDSSETSASPASSD